MPRTIYRFILAWKPIPLCDSTLHHVSLTTHHCARKKYCLRNVKHTHTLTRIYIKRPIHQNVSLKHKLCTYHLFAIRLHERVSKAIDEHFPHIVYIWQVHIWGTCAPSTNDFCPGIHTNTLSRTRFQTCSSSSSFIWNDFNASLFILRCFCHLLYSPLILLFWRDSSYGAGMLWLHSLQ